MTETDDTRHLACVHIRRAVLDATATATYALDADGPVSHELPPVRMRLCALCAGWLYATLHRIESDGPLSCTG